MITREQLKTQLTYNSLTGEFIFNKKKGGMPKGSVAGYAQRDGYIVISINGKQYKAHRLAWLYVHGAFPDYQIDHINMKRGDNRMANLREATKSQNHMNRTAYSNNKLGVKGVHMVGRKFRALIKKNGNQVCLGVYDSLDDASDAYKKASQAMHGSFSRA